MSGRWSPAAYQHLQKLPAAISHYKSLLLGPLVGSSLPYLLFHGSITQLPEPTDLIL